MSSHDHPPDRPTNSELNHADHVWLDEIADQFEAAWRAVRDGAATPRLEDFVTESNGPRGLALLRDLIGLDADYRRKRGETPQVEDYLGRFPALDPHVRRGSPDPAAPPTEGLPRSASNRNDAGDLRSDKVARSETGHNKSETPSLDRAFLKSVLALPGDAELPDDPNTPHARVRRVRCPHCQSPIRLVDNRPDEVLCPSCGSSFRLRDTRMTSTVAHMRQIGKFQLIERLGVGAFGEVWKAKDTQLDKTVALKMPHAGSLESEQDRQRFLREARAASQLRHPGIVAVHDVVELETATGKVPDIVSDFVDGITLRDLLQTRRLTFRESAELIAQLAESLDHAHSLGIIHRDIKPANVIIDYPIGLGLSAPLDADSTTSVRRGASDVRRGAPDVRRGSDVRRGASDVRRGSPDPAAPPTEGLPHSASNRSTTGDLRSDEVARSETGHNRPARPRPMILDFGLALRACESFEPRPSGSVTDKDL